MPTRSTEAATWEAALLRLPEDVYTFARSGPRRIETTPRHPTPARRPPGSRRVRRGRTLEGRVTPWR